MADTATPTPEQIQQVINQAATPASSTPLQNHTSNQIEFKTETGQVFKGGSWEEIAQQMKGSIEAGTSHIHNLNTQLETLRATPAQQSPVPTGNAKTPQDIYWEKWQKDPIDAQRYADSIRLGVPEDQVDMVLRGTMHSAAQASQATAANEFLSRCPDFPQTPQAVNMLTSRMQQRFGAIRPTADHLELAYHDLIRAGVLQPAMMPVESIEGRPNPSPTLGPSGNMGGQQQDFMAQFQQLPIEKMAEVLNELHRKGLR